MLALQSRVQKMPTSELALPIFHQNLWITSHSSDFPPKYNLYISCIFPAFFPNGAGGVKGSNCKPG